MINFKFFSDNSNFFYLGAKFSYERNDKIILKRKSSSVYTEMTELN